jgi:hypothetical protein
MRTASQITGLDRPGIDFFKPGSNTRINHPVLDSDVYLLVRVSAGFVIGYSKGEPGE